MRASPRKRSARMTGTRRGRALACAVAGGLALGLACSAGPVLAGSPVAGRATVPVQQATPTTVSRAQVPGATAKAVAPLKVVKPVAPVKTVAPAPVKPVAPAKASPGVPRVLAPPKAVTPTHAVPARPTLRAGANAASVHPQVPAVVASMRPAVNPVPAPSASAARLDDQVTYQYNALGRRDPFMPLIDGAEYVAIEAPPDVGAIKVVGIVWGSEDKFAIIEDGRGNSSVLRPGDKVMNGVVEGLKRDGVIVTITVDGQSQSVTIPLTRKGDSNANR
jgi:hypothetical protein